MFTLHVYYSTLILECWWWWSYRLWQSPNLYWLWKRKIIIILFTHLHTPTSPSDLILIYPLPGCTAPYISFRFRHSVQYDAWHWRVRETGKSSTLSACPALSQPYSLVCHRERIHSIQFIQRKQSAETWPQKNHNSTCKLAGAWWSLVLFYFVSFFYHLLGVCCLLIDWIVFGNTSLFWEKQRTIRKWSICTFCSVNLKMSVFINLLCCYLPLCLC